MSLMDLQQVVRAAAEALLIGFLVGGYHKLPATPAEAEDNHSGRRSRQQFGMGYQYLMCRLRQRPGQRL
jgi:hypothetical protein